MTETLSPAGLEAALRQIGEERYHWNHPFHIAMKSGELTKAQVQAWALNRYYYQAQIPIKDATLLARMRGSGDAPRLARADHRPRRRARRRRRHRALAQAHRRPRARARLRDLDRGPVAGDPVRGPGLRPVRARALAARGDRVVADRDVLAQDHRRPGLGHARELRFRQPRDAGLFREAPEPGAARCRFRARLRQARGARRPEQQQAVLDALRFKCDVLWVQLDALEHAYVVPGRIPPDAFRPEAG